MVLVRETERERERGFFVALLSAEILGKRVGKKGRERAREGESKRES